MSSSSIMMIKGTSLSALTEALQRYMPEVVGTLAKEYKFDQVAGLELLGDLSVQKEGKSRAVKAKRVVPKILLPFCGVVQDDWCKAVRYNRGLFTQCTNACKGDSKFCTTCMKHVSVDGIPQYGLIEERGNEGWKCPKGKSPVNYGNIMAKIDVTKDQAIAEAEKLGWTIPEEQFEVVKTRKGRPAKKAKEADEKPKKRGRPKKTKPVVEAAGTGDDLIAQLVQQAQQQNEVVAAQETEDEESVDGSEPTESPDEESTEDEVEEKPKKKVARKKKTAEEKEAEKKAKAEAKAKLAAEKKAAKEAEKEAAKLAKAEAKAKLAAEKKAAKEAEKKAKAEAKKAEKVAKAEAKKAEKKPAAVEKIADEESPKTLTPTEEVVEEMGELQIESPTPLDEEEEDDEVEVVKFTHEGIEYLRDANNIVYDIDTQEEIGEWDGKYIRMDLE